MYVLGPYGRSMVTTGSIASGAATDAGLMAASIAVFGFLAHAWPALSRAPEDDIRWATAIGGLFGCALALAVIFLSAIG